MPNLFPIEYDADMAILIGEEANAEAEATSTPIGYRQAPYFDFERGDFVLDGAGRIVTATGKQAWEHWCIKTVFTQKDACLSYPEHGVDIISALHAIDRSEAENIIERTITDGLMNDPYGRTMQVLPIIFDWIDDTHVNVDVTVLGIEEGRCTINTMVTI